MRETNTAHTPQALQENTMQAKQDVYSRVTDQIIEHLERGVRPWVKPWDASHAHGRITLPCRHNGVAYRGVNILLLWTAAIASGYTSSRWLTYKQISELGGNVRKGEHGSLVVFASTYHKTETETADDGAETARDIGFLKGYMVFNADQAQNLPPGYQAVPDVPAEPLQLIEQAERFFAATGATFRYGGDRAYYSPSLDLIQMPPAEAFRDAESFAATKAHELVHLTSHPSRLDRVLGKRFGDSVYIIEELIALS
jgi:antirestriction protein ArdC